MTNNNYSWYKTFICISYYNEKWWNIWYDIHSDNVIYQPKFVVIQNFFLIEEMRTFYLPLLLLILQGKISLQYIHYIWLYVWEREIFFVTWQFFTNNFSSRGSTEMVELWKSFSQPRDLSKKKSTFFPLSCLKRSKNANKLKKTA